MKRPQPTQGKRFQKLGYWLQVGEETMQIVLDPCYGTRTEQTAAIESRRSRLFFLAEGQKPLLFFLIFLFKLVQIQDS